MDLTPGKAFSLLSPNNQISYIPRPPPSISIPIKRPPPSNPIPIKQINPSVTFSENIQFIILGINIYGYEITMKIIGFVKEYDNNNKKIYPLGKKIRYIILEKEYIIYDEVPDISYINGRIFFSDKSKFNFILQDMVNNMHIINIPMHKNLGIKILDVTNSLIINDDKRIVTLTNDEPPKQSHYRILYDMIDQIVHPSANVRIIYYLKNEKYLYADYLDTIMNFKFENPIDANHCINPYDSAGNNIIFNDISVGKFIYNIYNGHFNIIMTEQFRNSLFNEFKKSYPDAENINIYLIALEVMVNNSSLIFG